MLNMILGYPHEVVYDTSTVLGVDIDKHAVETEFGRHVIKYVDRSVVRNFNEIDSPVLGEITYKELSHGVCGLIILHESDMRVPIEYLGDNCLELLQEIVAYRASIGKDVNVCCGYMKNLFKFGIKEIFIVNTGVVVHNYLEFLDEYDKVASNDFYPYDVDTRTKKQEAERNAEFNDLWGDLL